MSPLGSNIVPSRRSHGELENVGSRAALERAYGFGRTSLIDATYAGMVVGESSIGRPLSIVFSDGVDTSSWLSAEAVLDIARRSDVVVYCISTGRARKPGFAAEVT